MFPTQTFACRIPTVRCFTYFVAPVLSNNSNIDDATTSVTFGRCRPFFSESGDKHYRDLGVIRHVSIDDFRGACAVKGNVQVAGHVKRVDHGDAFNA